MKDAVAATTAFANAQIHTLSVNVHYAGKYDEEKEKQKRNMLQAATNE